MIGFFGGTFDPVHLGHLHAARTVARTLDCREMRLVLAARPAHRDSPIASVDDRWAMLTLALAGDPICVADDREMRRAAPSYTVDTLEDVRAEVGARMSLVWCIGSDQLRELTSWHRPERLLELAHLAVLERPTDAPKRALPADVSALVAHRLTQDPARLRDGVGRILLCTAPMLAISASAVRRAIVNGDPTGELLPPEVSTYIRRHRLYGGSGYP